MVIIDMTKGAAAIYLPLNGFAKADEGGTARLTITSTMDLTSAALEIEGVEYETGDYFALVRFGIPEDLTAGEYEYALTAEIDGTETKVSSGIMQFMEGTEQPVEYKPDIDYKQYGE